MNEGYRCEFEPHSKGKVVRAMHGKCRMSGYYAFPKDNLIATVWVAYCFLKWISNGAVNDTLAWLGAMYDYTFWDSISLHATNIFSQSTEITMDIWILEVDVPDECDKSISIWDSEEEARKQACSEIQEEIANSWDLSNATATTRDIAKEINEHIAAGRWHKAMKCWNESEINNRANSPIYWSVRSRCVRNKASDPLVRPESDFDDSESTKADCDGNCGDCACSKPFVATVPGATCRKCKYHSEYAYADKEDGTFICRACKMMMDVFTPGD